MIIPQKIWLFEYLYVILQPYRVEKWNIHEQKTFILRL